MQCLDGVKGGNEHGNVFIKRQRAFLLQTVGHPACELANCEIVLGSHTPRMHWAQVAATLCLECHQSTR